jgi:transposase-like protein
MARKKYTSEFRESAVRLVTREGVAASKAAADLGVSYHTLLSWVAQARRGGGVFKPLTERELQARVRELEAENRRLTIERDILKEATAFFAKESGGRP